MSLRPYRALLARPSVPSLMLAAVLGRMPTGMAGLAIVLLVRETAGSYGVAGLVAGAYAVAVGIASPVQGRLIDRIGQTRVLAACGLACAGAFASMALLAGQVGIGALVACAAVAGAANPPLAPCIRALWPSLVGEGSDLQTAYALESTVQELIFIAGPLFVVGLVALSSPSLAILGTGVLALAGTVWFACSAASRAWRGSPRAAGWAGPLRGRGIRDVLAVILLLSTSFGVVLIAVPAFAEDLEARAASGWLFALWGLGSMAGGLLYGGRTWAGDPARRLAALLGLVAVGITAMTAASGVTAMGGVMLGAGLPIAPAVACAYLLVDRLAPRGTVTEAFTWVSTGFMAGSALGSALGGLVVEHAGTRAAFLAAAATVAAAALVAHGRHAGLAPAVPAGDPDRHGTPVGRERDAGCAQRPAGRSAVSGTPAAPNGPLAGRP